MSRLITKIVLTALLLPVISGCVEGPHYYWQNQNQVYLRSMSVPPLVIPPDLSASKIDTYYEIPGVEGSVLRSAPLLPPGSLAEAKAAAKAAKAAARANAKKQG